MKTVMNAKLKRVLIAMLELEAVGDRPASANEIAYQCGYRPGMAKSGNSGRGNTRRVMGPAVHVTAALTSLRRLGMISLESRRDGLPGSADMLTHLGRTEARKAQRDGLTSNAARAEGKGRR